MEQGAKEQLQQALHLARQEVKKLQVSCKEIRSIPFDIFADMHAFFYSVNSLLFLAPQHRFAGSVKEINKGNQIIEQLQNAQVC